MLILSADSMPWEFCLGYDGFSMPLGSHFAPLWLWLGYIMYGMDQSDSVPWGCLVACNGDGL